MFALSLFLPMFFILLPRKIPPPPMGRIQDMGKKSKKAMPCSVVTPPAFFPTLPGVYRRSRERAGLAALLRPRIPARPVQLVHSPIRWPSSPSAVVGGGQGTAISTPGLCIGTRRVSIHWHTPHHKHPHRCTRGAQKGGCERVWSCIAPLIATERRPFLGRWPRRRGRRQPAIPVAS